MKLHNKINEALYEVREIFKSTDFAKAVLLGISLTLPILVGIKFDMLETGIVITVGAMLASPSDISGRLQSKVNGILLSALLAMTVSFIGGSLRFSYVVMFPIIGILMFGISYLSIFGFRASLISFSGLFALVLSFSPISGDMPVIERSLLIGAGGLWYVFMAILWHYLFPKGPTEYYLTKTFNLTADYLRLRGRLVKEKDNRPALLIELLQIQTDLTETHETLRNILISRRTGSGKSFYEGKRLLIFSILIDMLELAMANPVNYTKTDQIFDKKPEHLQDFQNLLFQMAHRLEQLGESISNPKRLKPDLELKRCLKLVQKDMSQVSDEILDEIDEDVLMLRNLYKYQAEQVKKIEKMEWLVTVEDRSQVRFIKNEYARRFLTREDYNINILIENFNFNSLIFRHSLRLAMVAIVGYAVGILFEVQNSYWILLTIIVIMRPNFGLTKQRSKERTIGTIIGGILAVGVVLLVKNLIVFGVLSIITLIISFSMIQRNYKAAATFITLSVIFTFALLTPDIFEVIKFRVLDTVIGTGLAIAGNLLLWPAWEIRSMHQTLLDIINANKRYFEQIINYYTEKGEVASEYRIARKQAFLKLSNLNSAFQRMTQEPKSRQEKLGKFYELVELNHAFLASLASLGTYILTNPTTPASKNFKLVTAEIINNLEICEQILNDNVTSESELIPPKDDIFEITYGKEELHQPYQKISDNSNFYDQVEEAHLIREQLRWLLSMSLKMQKLLLQVPVH